MRIAKCIFLVLISTVSFLTWTCPVTRAEPLSGDLVVARFPVDIGRCWDYKRIFYMEIHDTVNGGFSYMLFKDSLHAEFVDVDTILGWECFEYNSKLFSAGNVYSDTVWYAHPDTAFFEIGYRSPTTSGPPWMSPGELHFKFGDRFFTSVDQLKYHLYRLRFSSFAGASANINLWKPPKRLFVFPLAAGMLWVSMGEPWKEEREVMGEERIRVPAGDFQTLRIEMRPDIGGVGLRLYEWLSEQGVIKDSAYFGPSPVMDEFGQVYGYMTGYDKYDLIGPTKTQVADQDLESGNPLRFSLAQNYPNPFNPSTVIRFSLSVDHPTETTLRIYNILGQEVRSLIHEQMDAGSYQVVWDGKDDGDAEISSGIYFYKLEVGGLAVCRRMLLLR